MSSGYISVTYCDSESSRSSRSWASCSACEEASMAVSAAARKESHWKDAMKTWTESERIRNRNFPKI